MLARVRGTLDGSGAGSRPDTWARITREPAATRRVGRPGPVHVADGDLMKEDPAMPTWNNLTNTTFDEIQAGAEASLTRTLSQTDIEVLALVSGDVDPFHVAGDGTVRPDGRTTEAAGA